MFGRLGSRGALAAALMMGMAASGGIGGGLQGGPMVATLNAPRRAKKGLFGGSYSHNPMQYGIKGARITMAQQKRASIKAKNVKRHKKHAK